MSDGPGKYDPLATYVREEARADAVIVVVIGGYLGSGFSVQALGSVAEEVRANLAALLREIAVGIEQGE